MIYKTYILPVLECGLYILDNVNKKHVNRLQVLQNKALRICFKKDNRFSAFPLHQKANLLSLDYRSKICLLNMIYMKLLKCDRTFCLSSRKDNRTRAGACLETVLPKFERFRRSLNYQGPIMWNNLPQICRNNQFPPIFKVNLRRHFHELFVNRGAVK